jgi:hypothetical protein
MKVYRLRPHHIDFLYGFILNGEETSRGGINSPDPDYMKAFDNESVPKEYSKEMVDALMSFCKKLTKSKDSYIKVVNGIDDICVLGCNRKRPECKEKDDYDTVKKIRLMFGLNVGEKCSTPNLIGKMKELKEYLLDAKD